MRRARTAKHKKLVDERLLADLTEAAGKVLRSRGATRAAALERYVRALRHVTDVVIASLERRTKAQNK